MRVSDVKAAIVRTLEDHDIDDRGLVEDLVDSISQETGEVEEDEEDPSEDPDGPLGGEGG